MLLVEKKRERQFGSFLGVDHDVECELYKRLLRNDPAALAEAAHHLSGAKWDGVSPIWHDTCLGKYDKHTESLAPEDPATENICIGCE